MYDVDSKSAKRLSHENEHVQMLYKTVLDHPLSEKSHHLLHRRYVDRKKEAKAAAGRA
jgi:hypothetical protein